VPRTENPKKRAIRLCGECGYELAADSDGTCTMCPRFEQLRTDFTVPRPSDLAAHRASVRDTDGSAAPDEWPPSVAEYRAILAERRGGSTSADQSHGRVIRTPGLRQIRVPPPPGSAIAADDEVLAAPISPRRPGQEPSSTPPERARVRKGKDGDRRAARRAARVRAGSPPAAEENRPHPRPSSLAARTSADLTATDSLAAPPRGPEARRDVAVESVPAPRQFARPLMHAAPVRRVESGSRARYAAGRSLVTVTVVLAASALIGVLVPLVLSLP